MPGPMTVVTLQDEDGDEFPFALPGVYRTNRKDDICAAFKLAGEAIEHGAMTPTGELSLKSIRYHGGHK